MTNKLKFVKKIQNTLDCILGLIDPFSFMKNKLKECSRLEWYKIIVYQILHVFFKYNVYKHVSLIFGKKIKYKLSIPSALDLSYQLMNFFEFNEIDCN